MDYYALLTWKIFSFTDESFKLKNLIGKDNFGESIMLLYFVFSIHKNFLEEPSVVKLFSDPKEKFDAVILEWFFSELNAG